jgi:hypothetical protein
MRAREATHPTDAYECAWGFSKGSPSASIATVIDDTTLTWRQFELELDTGPSADTPSNSAEVDFDPETRRRLEEKLRLIDDAQTKAYSESRDYYLT